jgi:hypothetical protein
VPFSGTLFGLFSNFHFIIFVHFSSMKIKLAATWPISELGTAALPVFLHLAVYPGLVHARVDAGRYSNPGALIISPLPHPNFPHCTYHLVTLHSNLATPLPTETTPHSPLNHAPLPLSHAARNLARPLPT